MTQSVTIIERKSPNIILRFLYFLLFGWWVGYIVITVAGVLEVSIIGIPLAFYLMDRIPAIMTLKARSSRIEVYTDAKGRLKRRVRGPEQYKLWLRLLYFVLAGWWLSGFWVAASFACAATIIGTPVAFWMVDRVPFISSLTRV